MMTMMTMMEDAVRCARRVPMDLAAVGMAMGIILMDMARDKAVMSIGSHIRTRLLLRLRTEDN
jgi:predicted choloylglycine hydrolase